MLTERERESIRAQSMDGLLEWHLRYRGTPNSVGDLLDMVAAAVADADAADAALANWVVAARRYGATWHEIGTAIGASRQAAQKRFGDALPPLPDLDGTGYRTITDVAIADELSVLSTQGQNGYMLAEVGAGTLAFVEAYSTVEHRRIPLLAHGPSAEEYRRDGWEVIARSYPFLYLARTVDAGRP